MLAVKVEIASCSCFTGAGGVCHHICMLLQLVRLLRMTAHDLSANDMTEVTSRQCQWRLNHCRGGRGPEDNMWLELKVPKMVPTLAGIPQPIRRQKQKLSVEDKLHKRGTVHPNRQNDFNPLTQGESWMTGGKTSSQDS